MEDGFYDYYQDDYGTSTKFGTNANKELAYY